MQLVRLKMRNFRCYREETSIEFDDLTAIIGRNDAGKSTILEALAVFFDEAKLDKDDASVNGERGDVEISCEFADFPLEAVIDQDFQTSFEDEYLLNSHGRLEIVKKYNGELATPKITGIYARANHPTAEGYRDLLQLKKRELTERAEELGVDLTKVNRKANAPVRAAIWQTATNLNIQETLVPLDEADAKQVWSRLGSYLPTFALFKSDRASTDQDTEAQDPLKTAIKDAIKAKEAELQRIQEHVEEEVRKIAKATVEKIKEMDPTLASTLSPVITAKKWDSLFQTSITGDEGIPLNKRGSGVKRLVLLNFFRAKAERAAHDAEKTSVIYAVEEPETSQHPRNQRMLMAALTNIATMPGRQVIVTTHTPMLARAVPKKCLRFVRQTDHGTREILVDDGATNDISDIIVKSLGILPDNSVKLFVGVEGKHDITFLKGISKVLRAGDIDVPDLDALELDGKLIFFPFGGENLALWSSRLSALRRPEFHICDRDRTPPAEPKYQSHVNNVNTREDCAAVSTEKREMENYIHHEAVVEAYQANGSAPELAGPFQDFDDVPVIVAKAVHAASGSPTAWAGLDRDTKNKKSSKAKAMLNGPAVDKMTVARLRATDPNNEIIGWFNRMRTMMAQSD
jgi:predicted ATPase